ncbi:MAG: penicillin-binding protein 2, partial [Proteobacteria bacterium]|nr:penicillin-binding protein 2 [Pseudomonadota bacterium]
MSPAFRFRRRMKILGSRSADLDTARGRAVLASAFFALFYILIAIRIFDLSIVQGELRRSGEPDMIANALPASSSAVRADIVDRNGALLATSLETASLYADPSLVVEPEKTAQDLVDVIPGLIYGDILQKLQRKGRFVWLKRNLTPEEQHAVLTIGDPALGFQAERKRIYPQGALAAHVVGFSDLDGHGLAGVERSFERLLSDGGDTLKLSLDIRVQYIVRRELAEAVRTFSALGGAGIVMDIASGEVLAAVSWPDFDPHDPGGSSDTARFNRFSLGTYEPGSTFKIFSTAALLDTLNVPMGTAFDARAPLERGRFTISDYHPEKRALTVPEVFMYSSNIGAALMGEMVGTKALRDFYEDLGLFAPLPLEIGEAGRPQYPDPWRDINTLTASYGHGIAVSPMRLVAAASSIVGGGTIVQPTLIAGKQPQKNHDLRVVSPQTAHRMRQLMRLVVADPEGTGKKADVPGYSVGGKTGTADKSSGGGYDRNRKISSFMGFFPMEAPRYAVFIMVDEPRGTKASFGYATGGWVAAPAVKKIIEGMAADMGTPPVNTPPEKDMAA